MIILGGPAGDKQDPLQSKLNKVEQLTGFSDPVYAEAYVNVNQYDIVLDVLVVNQTADTLQVHIAPVPRREDQKYSRYARALPRLSTDKFSLVRYFGTRNIGRFETRREAIPNYSCPT